MGNLRVSLILSRNPRTEPIINGEVRPEGIDLAVTVAHPSEIFWRQLHNAEFDACEMSMSSLIIARLRGDLRFAGIPVFSTRRFFHTWILVRRDRGIESPADLAGKRVGVPEYQQTAAVWSRGVLQHEFSVAATGIEWFMERTESMSHGGATGFVAPAGVKINRIPAASNIGTMMAAGELDATLLYLREPNLVDRSVIDLDRHPQVRALFPDATGEGARYFAKTGLHHINHGMAVKQTVLDQHPWVALSLYNAFVEAKDWWEARSRELMEVHLQTGDLALSERTVLQRDPFPCGVRANRTTLETLTRYSAEQGLSPRQASLEELFAPAMLDL